VQQLQLLGWIDGRNMRIDYRWSAGDAERVRRYASELVALLRMSSSPLAARS
jgi:putative ABC transport system substrate-binding protein